MGIFIKSVFTVLGVSLSVSVALAFETLPTDFPNVSIDDPTALEFVSKCRGKDTSKKEFNAHVQSAKKKNIVVTRFKDKSKPYVRYSSKYIYCVPQSPQGNPILPSSAFDKTIEFNGMPEKDTAKLRANLSDQLARTGAATILVVHENGNAFLVAYLFARQNPSEIYYRSSFIKASDIVYSDYGNIFKSIFDSHDQTDRGERKFYFKSLFKK